LSINNTKTFCLECITCTNVGKGTQIIKGHRSCKVLLNIGTRN
jgi:hypothetical protein